MGFIKFNQDRNRETVNNRNHKFKQIRSGMNYYANNIKFFKDYKNHDFILKISKEKIRKDYE